MKKYVVSYDQDSKQYYVSIYLSIYHKINTHIHKNTQKPN